MPKSPQQLDFDIKNLNNKVESLRGAMSVNKSELKNQSSELLTNRLNVLRSGFSDLMQATHAGARDIAKQFSYPAYVTPQMYLDRYNRQDIANRVINAYPEACWSGEVKVTDDAETDNETEFEKQYIALNRSLKLSNYMTRIDKLTGLGEFAVLYIGLNDMQPPSAPVLEDRQYDSSDILFLKPFSQAHAKVSTYNEDPTSPRFGFPETYNLEIGQSTSDSKLGTTVKTQLVHWTRVIHVAEGALESDLVGLPRMLPIFNRLIDLEKVVGASAELFWLNGRGGLNFNAPIDANITKSNKEDMINQIEDYVHELTRVLTTRGVDVKALEFSVPDPASNVEVILKLISGGTGIPQRILTGSERGELASSQDQNNFDARVQERQQDFCGPEILRQLVDWFIGKGILPEPLNDEYDVVFPPVGGLSEGEKADRSQKLSASISSVVNAFGVESFLTKKQIVEEVWGLEFKETEVEQDDSEEGERDLLESADETGI